MEEQVGQLWHRFITRVANTHYPEAAVHLQQVNRSVGILFRALGGDGGLQIEAAAATEHQARRNWLQRIAGNDRKIELAWRDDHSLRLPASIDCFPTKELNRNLYLWLAILAVEDKAEEEPWFTKNQRLTLHALEYYPGIQSRYRRLVAAHLTLRPDPGALPEDEAVQEQAVRSALLHPGSVDNLPMARRPPQPVSLWLHPSPPLSASQSLQPTSDDEQESPTGKVKELENQHRRQAERADAPEKDRGLITIRMENIFTWGEYVKVDRGSEENEDLDQAGDVAEDMDKMSITRDGKSSAGRIRFDLDLPSEANDDLILNEGILFPEWDYKTQRLQPDYCRLVPMLARKTESRELPDHLHATAKRLRAQFQQLAPARTWQRGLEEGNEIDLDAYLRYTGEKAAGQAVAADRLYRDLRSGARDLACMLLADLSLSTDTWVNDEARVIDVIRDSLHLFAESLAATGDRFAMYGFSSRKRDPVRIHQIKTFEEHFNAGIRGRINAIKPGYYTRMGAAVRYSANLLKEQPAQRRLLLLLTDGKPNDLDKYEGRYGIEDTRQAIHEARQQGLQPFCVTIDKKANDYLPYLFGGSSFVVIHKPSQLPKELPLLYARLTSD